MSEISDSPLETNHEGSPKRSFLEKAQGFFQLPSVFHGTHLGLVLLAAKVVFYLTQNWSFVFESPYMFFSFTLLMYAVFMASRAERKEMGGLFTFWKAFGSGFRVISIAITLSILADGILYAVDKDLANQTIQIQIEKSVEAFKNVSFIKESDKDFIIKELKKQKPASYSALFGAWIGKVFSNAFFLIFSSVIFRYKKGRNERLNSPENEG